MMDKSRKKDTEANFGDKRLDRQDKDAGRGCQTTPGEEEPQNRFTQSPESTMRARLHNKPTLGQVSFRDEGSSLKERDVHQDRKATLRTLDRPKREYKRCICWLWDWHQLNLFRHMGNNMPLRDSSLPRRRGEKRGFNREVGGCFRGS